MAERIDVQPVKGTRDFYPEDMRVRQWLFGLWRETARRYGYEEYDACVLEHEELYVRKAGDEITGQLYNFLDKGERRVALRPELTPSLARMVMAKGAALALPARWFAIPQCFRYENMQRGRKREHFQWNMDVIGLPSVAAEAELMAAQVDFLRATGMRVDAGAAGQPEITLRVSNRQVLQAFLDGLGIAGERFAAVCVVIDKLDKIGRSATAELLGQTGVDQPTAQRVLDLVTVGGQGAAGVEAVAAAVGNDNPGVAALRELLVLAQAFGFDHLVRIDLSVVRGLSYYTGTVWEVFWDGTLQRAIAGGGRYDGLIEHLGGTPTPMAGFGFGDVVITEILEERGLLPKDAAALRRQVDDVIWPMGASEFAIANRIAAKLRRDGRSVLVDYSGRRFKHAIQRAEAEGAARFLILGGNEVAAGECVIRTLGAERREERVPLSRLTD